MFAGVVAVLQSAQASVFQLLTTAVAAGLLLGTRIGIYTIMAVAAVVYAVAALL